MPAARVRTVDLMKKGLRLDNRTWSSVSPVRTVDLMKKGLRRGYAPPPCGSWRQNRRPDEEGIKTNTERGDVSVSEVRTVDLMKKGLRPLRRHRVAWLDVRTVDLMKKGLRLSARARARSSLVRTVDLMKKGLRHQMVSKPISPSSSEP